MAQAIKAAPSGSVKIDLPNLMVPPRAYQANDVAWMLAARQGIIGSGVGTGKTILAISLASYLKDRGQLRGMVVLLPKQAGVLPRQWAAEITRFDPRLRPVIAEGRDRRDRLAKVAGPWDVLLMNYEAARNEVGRLSELLPPERANVLYCDEASAFRNPGTKTHFLVSTLAPRFPFRFAVTGTPIETGVEDLYGICSGMGGEDLVGNAVRFRREFCITERVEFRVAGGMKRSKVVVVGYKNLDVLRARLDPFTIRRTMDDPEVAAEMPDLVSRTVRVPMLRAQAAEYQRVRSAAVSGGALTFTEASSRFMRLLAISDGLRTGDPDAADVSGKSDYLLELLTNGPFRHEKVLVFSRFVRSLRPLAARLEAAGIGYGMFIGGSHMTDAARMSDVDRFREDPNCRVLLATSAVERGLNLQVARAVVFYGIVSNPSRLEQIVGRIRRLSSTHSSVYAITLLSAGTVEEGLWDAAVERNAVADHYWEEESVLFERLGADRLMQLIRG